MQPDSGNQARWWDLPAALILIVALFLAALRLVATDWTEELEIIEILAVTATMSGLALGQSRFGRLQVAGIAIVYGAFMIGWQMGLLAGEELLWRDRLSHVLGQLTFAVNNLVNQRAVTDPALFVFLMSCLYWILCSHAAYTLTRYANAWRAALPMGLALFIIHIHDPLWPSRSWFLAGYIFLSLLLLSRVHYLHNRATWQRNRTHLPPYIGLDFLRATMIAGGALILLVWTVPALAASVPPAEAAWQRVARPWYEARAKMTNFFASLRATTAVAQDYYGDTLPLGRGNTLSDQVVMTILAPPRPAAGVRYYWRARVYNFWDGTRWLSQSTSSQALRPDDFALSYEEFNGRWEATFRFFPGIAMATIYTAPQPQWVSRPVSAEIIPNPDETVDLYSLVSSPNVRPGEVYDVQSSLTNVTLSQLRAAGTDYPGWVQDRYLQVPNGLTARTLELAQQIAEPYDNPYDVTQAITQWMRENITYNEIVPTPPQNQDIIDWMLFDLQQGFCNYYATAEILMLRSLGIPARLAVGYAQGQRDAENNTYTVRQRDAHAWPEVYFPGIGWVEFEPTLNQRPIQRPVGDPANENNTASGSFTRGIEELPDLEALLGEDLDGSASDTNVAPDDPFPTWPLFALPFGIALIGVSAVAWYRSRQRIRDREPKRRTTPIPVKIESGFRRIGLRPPAFLRYWSYLASLPEAARAYLELNRALTRLGNPPERAQTPSERAFELAQLLPESRDELKILLAEYHSLAYSNQNGAAPIEGPAYFAGREIRRLSWIALWQRFWSRFQRIGRDKLPA